MATRRKRSLGRRLLDRLSSVRLRAALALGAVVAAAGVTGTFASWTDEVTISGTSLTAGTLDLRVNSADAYATTTLGMPAMVPGSTSAEVLTVRNSGTAPLKYTLTGGLTGTNAGDYSAAGANGLLLTIRLGGTRTTSGTNATCTGGTALVTDAPLTATLTTSILAKRPAATMAPTGTEALCFQIKLADGAPTTLQGRTATASFTATGTSDLS